MENKSGKLALARIVRSLLCICFVSIVSSFKLPPCDDFSACCVFQGNDSVVGAYTRTIAWNSSTDFRIYDTYSNGLTQRIAWGSVLNNSDIPCMVASILKQTFFIA